MELSQLQTQQSKVNPVDAFYKIAAIQNAIASVLLC